MAVRGTFDLSDRPAVDALGRIKRAGAESDVVLSDLGRTMDDVFSERNALEARGYTRDLNGVRDAALEVEAALRSVGTTDARPNVNLRGYSETMAQLDAIEMKLRRIGTLTARPNVNPSSSRVPFGGGGGSFGGGGGGFSVPFGGAVPWWLAGVGLAAAPPLIGGATALAGSAGAAALGAGALGLTGGATAAVGAGLAAGPTVAAVKGISQASKALEAYQQQVIQTGPNSQKAAQKLREYNMAAREAPGASRFLRARTLFGEEFNAATRPGQQSVAAIGTRGINLGRELLPTIAPLSNRFMGQAQQQTDRFADFLGSNRSKGFINSLGNEAIADLPLAEETLENVAGTIENIARASRPFFHEGVVFLRDWTRGWERSSHDLTDTREEIGGLVDQLKTWAHLGGAGFDLVRDLMSPAAGPGQTMVEDLTGQLREWDRWVEDNPRQVKEFFSDSVDGTEKIAGALGRILQMLWRVGQQLTPLLEQGGNLVELLSNAGLLTPGGIPLLIGAGRGVQGVFNRGGAATGAAGAGAPLVLGGAAGGAGAAARGSVGRVLGAARTGAPMLWTQGATEGTSYWSRQGRGAYTLSTAGKEFGPAARRFGSGFLRGFGPYAALSFGLGAAGFQGDAIERLQSGLSSASLGLIAPPQTAGEKQEQGYGYANQVAGFQNQRFGADLPGLRRQLVGLHRKINALGVPQEAGGLKGFLTQDITGGGATKEISGVARAEIEALAKRRKEIFSQVIPEAQHGRAERRLGDITGAFGVQASHGKKGAFGIATDSISDEVGNLRGRTRREFSQMGLDWAKGLAQANPKLKNAFNEMAESIEHRLNKLGENVRVINGRIVDVSARSWDNVADLIGSKTQRAYAEANENFTALEKRAFTILENMGYSRTEAQSITHEAQTGRPTKAGASAGAAAHHHGKAGATKNNMATGGRLPYTGTLHDTIPLPGGGLAAGGELMIDGREIANRHTEHRINMMLGKAGYSTTLAHEIAMEGRPHSSQFREYNAALGGAVRRATGGSIMPAAQLAVRMGLNVGEGPGFGGIPSSGHAPNSLHYSGLAYDVSGSSSLMRAYRVAAERTFLGKGLNELFYDPYPYYIDEGNKVPGAIGGHSDHVHIGFFPGGVHGRVRVGRGGGAGARGGAAAAQHINLGSRGSKLGGAAGAMVGRAGTMEAAGMERNINKILARRGGGGGGLKARGGSVEAQIARVLFGGGLNRIGAAGVIGNAYAESSLDPSATGYGGGGLWGFTASPYSLADLQSYASGRGGSWTSATLQTQFLMKFIGSLIPRLNASPTPEAAAELFMTDFEKPGIPRLDVRQSGARTAFQHGYSTGGRRPGFGGWFGKGGHFRVRNPTLIGVGDRDEEVHITPRGRGRGGTGSGGHTFQIAVDLRGAHIGSAADADRIGKRTAHALAGELAGIMESSDGVPERELTG